MAGIVAIEPPTRPIRETQIARHLNSRRLWLVTTNDNLDALMVGARTEARRKLKPEIPLPGDHDIRVRD
jgi:hypothetical protein